MTPPDRDDMPLTRALQENVAGDRPEARRPLPRIVLLALLAVLPLTGIAINAAMLRTSTCSTRL